MKNSIALFLAVSFYSFSCFAASGSNLSYDLGGGSGSRNGETYSEINLGLNWYVQDWLNWRNALFTQFGSQIDSIYGLDSSLLFNVETYTQSRTFGVQLYAGPGVRFATENSNAVFGQAGVTLALGGLRIGGGVQALHYLEDRIDKNNRVLGKDETQYFIVLAGGGSL